MNFWMDTLPAVDLIRFDPYVNMFFLLFDQKNDTPSKKHELGFTYVKSARHCYPKTRMAGRRTDLPNDISGICEGQHNFFGFF